jgi:hypothetical protein
MFDKPITIYYHQYDNDCTRKESEFMYESCLSVDGIGYEPESLISMSDGEEIYSACPIWRHREERTFAIRSPIDFTVHINKARKGISVPNFTQDQFQNYVCGNADPRWCTDKRISIQLAIPKFIFWTDEKNIWIEQKNHWRTAVKNNFTAVGGWYNTSNWTRTINPCLDVVDHSKDIVVKRGNILYEVAFHAPKKSRKISLVKQTPPKQIQNRFVRGFNIKRFLPKKTIEFALGDTSSKCPFRFGSPQDKG